MAAVTSFFSWIAGLFLALLLALVGLGAENGYVTVTASPEPTVASGTSQSEEPEPLQLMVYYDVQELWGDQIFTVDFQNGSATLTISTEGDAVPSQSYELSQDEYEALQALLATYNPQSWNGFNEDTPDVLDGYSFTTEVAYSDGSIVYARGSNAAPAGWHQFYDEFRELIGPYISAFYA